MEMIYLRSVDSLDYNTNPNLIDLGVTGPGATVSDIGSGANLSCSSSLMSSEILCLSNNEICDVASIPTTEMFQIFLLLLKP